MLHVPGGRLIDISFVFGSFLVRSQMTLVVLEKFFVTSRLFSLRNKELTMREDHPLSAVTQYKRLNSCIFFILNFIFGFLRASIAQSV